MKLLLTYITLMMVSCTAVSQHTKKKSTMNQSFEKFDIEDYKHKVFQPVEGDQDLNHFTLKDGTEIYRAGYPEYFTEERILPKPSFLKWNKQFYPSGFIKFKGLSFGDQHMGANGIRVGQWTYFDELGKVTKTVDEDRKFGNFGYNELLAFLDKEGLIEVKTGKNRENVNAIFESSESGDKTWFVEIITEFHPDDYAKGWTYTLDGNSGKVLKKAKVYKNYAN